MNNMHAGRGGRQAGCGRGAQAAREGGQAAGGGGAEIPMPSHMRPLDRRSRQVLGGGHTGRGAGQQQTHSRILQRALRTMRINYLKNYQKPLNRLPRLRYRFEPQQPPQRPRRARSVPRHDPNDTSFKR